MSDITIFKENFYKDEYVNEFVEHSINVFNEQGHYFKVNNDTLGLFLSTKPTICYEALRLPFKSIYLDVKIPLYQGTINGIFLTQNSLEELNKDDYLSEKWDIEREEDFLCEPFKKYYSYKWLNVPINIRKEFREYQINAGSINISFMFVDSKGLYYFEDFYCCYSSKGDLIIESGTEKHELVSKEYNINKNDKIILNLLKNFCLYCNDPRVTTVSRKLSYKDLFKRNKRKQAEVPNLMLTLVKEELRRYIVESRPYFYDFLFNLKNKFKGKISNPLKHSFWVKGHYRKLRSNKFKNKLNKLIWIAPYKKGQGMLIKQEFVLKNKKRIRKINDDSFKQGI